MVVVTLLRFDRLKDFPDLSVFFGHGCKDKFFHLFKPLQPLLNRQRHETTDFVIIRRGKETLNQGVRPPFPYSFSPLLIFSGREAGSSYSMRSIDLMASGTGESFLQRMKAFLPRARDAPSSRKTSALFVSETS